MKGSTFVTPLTLGFSSAAAAAAAAATYSDMHHFTRAVTSGVQGNASANRTNHCYVPNQLTYRSLSWLVIGEFVLGLPLSLSVLYIFIFRFKFWKNKSVFLFNIAVADFLLVACLPFKAYHYLQGQRRSSEDALCKSLLFMLFLNRGASIAFLVILSLDRYFNVVHLGRRNCVRALKKSPQVSVVVWLLLLPLTAPTMHRTFECCNSLGRQSGTEAESKYHNVTDCFREVVFFSQIIIPFFVLVFCTVRIVKRLREKTVGEKAKLRRAACLVMSVVVVFSVCFLPCAIARAVLLTVRLKDWQAAEDIVVQVYDGLMVLSYTDCLLDPLVYCFCNSGFKDAYVSTFYPTFLQKRLQEYDLGLGATTTTNSGARNLSLPILEK